MSCSKFHRMFTIDFNILPVVQSAVQMAVLRNAKNLNSGTVNMLVEGVQDVSRSILEKRKTPAKRVDQKSLCYDQKDLIAADDAD